MYLQFVVLWYLINHVDTSWDIDIFLLDYVWSLYVQKLKLFGSALLLCTATSYYCVRQRVIIVYRNALLLHTETRYYCVRQRVIIVYANALLCSTMRYIVFCISFVCYCVALLFCLESFTVVCASASVLIDSSL